jgi:hypothetical protein
MKWQKDRQHRTLTVIMKESVEGKDNVKHEGTYRSINLLIPKTERKKLDLDLNLDLNLNLNLNLNLDLDLNLNLNLDLERERERIQGHFLSV